EHPAAARDLRAPRHRHRRHDRRGARLRRLRRAAAASELGQHDFPGTAGDRQAAVARLYPGRVPVRHGAVVQSARRTAAGAVERRVTNAADELAAVAPNEGDAAPRRVGTPSLHPAPLLETRALTVRFGSGPASVTAVDGLSYRLAAGRTLAIVGESGAGKTLGCLALVGLVPRSAIVSGSVRFAGRELVGLDETELRRHRGRDIAFVLQDAGRALNPTLIVGEQIAEAARLHERLGRRASHTRAAELLGLLGLREPVLTASAYPHELSGGMRQRALLAIALAAGPRLLIADEITRSLDPLTRARMLELLVSLKDRLGMTLILVSHDLGLVTRVADEILVMRAGRAVEHAP